MPSRLYDFRLFCYLYRKVDSPRCATALLRVQLSAEKNAMTGSGESYKNCSETRDFRWTSVSFDRPKMLLIAHPAKLTWLLG